MPKFSSEERNRIYLSLLEKGKELFNAKGFSEVTAEDVALEAGIAKGTFYHFFENKEHLYMVINNGIQEDIFENVRKMVEDYHMENQSEQFYQVLCFVMKEFLDNPLIMEIDQTVWKRIEEKAPKDCIEDNNVSDLRMVQMLENSGITFRYDLEQTTRILQLQFLQLPYMKQKTQDIELMKIVLKALSEHLIKETGNENSTTK